MPSHAIKDRFRERSSPQPTENGGRIKAGTLKIIKMSNGEDQGDYQYVYTNSSTYPAERERTWDESHTGPPYLSGGGFTNTKVNFPQYQVQGVGSYWTDTELGGGTWRLKYEGGFCDPLWYPYFDSLSESDYYTLMINTINPTLLPDLDSLGSKAYARLRPTPEKAGLGLAVAEMRDLPRMLQSSAKRFSDIWERLGGNRRSKLMTPKKLSEDFINHNFGWVPFISDMRRISDTYNNAIKYRAQIKRDNNKWIKRFRADQDVRTEELLYEQTSGHGLYPGNGANFYGAVTGPYRYTITLRHLTEVWYEGVFKFYRPAFDDSTPWSNTMWGDMQRNLTMYGAHVTPTILYKATPWTWAIDWFSNLGDIIQETEDLLTDGAVSKYMYLMHHHKRDFELRSTFSTSDGVGKDLSWFRSFESKRRQGGTTAFQFSRFSELSAKQIAILAALGISRTKP